MAAIQAKFPSFREAEPSQTFSPAPGDQVMIFNGLSTLGTPVESVQSYRTADLLPAGSPLRDPTGNVAIQQHNDEIHKFHTTVSQLTDHRNTLASQFHAALTDNQHHVDPSNEAPTKATLHSMLAEANRRAAMTFEQRTIMVQQMHAADYRIAELES